ncbi:MAG: 4Fe-4S dicluster domain-containing protein [Desulfobulbales bacterium]|nr:4Fe-4S dicluster domain-containing protein [Desulfobulbales bacterium]
MKTTRRKFLQCTGTAVGASLLLGPNNAFGSMTEKDNSPQYGMLNDTTMCTGCQACEQACTAKNFFPEPEVKPETEKQRSTGTEALTVVNAHATEKGTVFVKTQCMHCDQPACVSACLVNAMYKTDEGPVIWKEDKCMGCRYCMVACPFDIPKFEYGSLNPKIRKCVMCFDRIGKGNIPVCAEACPQEAILFGTREELLEIARKRISDHPAKYVRHIYGEHEVGGTNILYLAGVPFAQLGFRTDLGTIPYPEYTKTFLYSVPLALLLAPAFMLGLRQATKGKNDRD